MSMFNFMRHCLNAAAITAISLAPHHLSASGISDCMFRDALDIEPVVAGRGDHYHGTGSRVEIIFLNERPEGAVEVFPEPPLTIRKIDSGSRCDIDGGAWVRAAVYLSSDENTLLVQEYSGSNDELVIYGTDRCERRGRIDVSGAKWKLRDSTLSFIEECASNNKESGVCGKRKNVDIRKYCR